MTIAPLCCWGSENRTIKVVLSATPRVTFVGGSGVSKYGQGISMIITMIAGTGLRVGASVCKYV